MHDRDQRFYAKLFTIFFLGAIAMRYYLKWIGFEFDIPYVDPFFEFLWAITGMIMTGISNMISPR